jgi:hypothetical protein
MEYRIEAAETEEEKEKELNFTGLGLTSRKNLCIHPDVRLWSLNYISHHSTIHRCPRRKKGSLWTLDAGI